MPDSEALISNMWDGFGEGRGSEGIGGSGLEEMGIRSRWKFGRSPESSAFMDTGQVVRSSRNRSDGGRKRCSESWIWCSSTGLARPEANLMLRASMTRPYFEWYFCNEDFTEYYNFEECLAYLEDYMIKHGPFDGLLGFSQGAILSAVLPGMQIEGVALTKVPLIKFLIIVSGTKFGGYKFGLPKLAANAFASPVKLPSLHFIGERDFLKERGIALLESFEDPTVIYHNRGHTVPRLG
ncbi:alpha/beta-Hydrolases superfamily protein [Actinidia rufa]|uniref:Alpha/beta-Hydrolases superfamily protein n=1 Tax=Actinidia rufa TaxID=165716 RepID=A0A7J0H661_9ERIC|nr:alpha/beta-Hydrolases superfamily protein [Actinidia rufa]